MKQNILNILITKKAQSESAEKSIFYILAGFFAIALCFLLAYLVVYNINQESLIPKDLEQNILINRFLNSPFCFTYYHKELLRSYPLILDETKLTQENIERCYYAKKDSPFAFKLSFAKTETILKTNNWIDGKNIAERKRFLVYVYNPKENYIYSDYLYIDIQKNEE